MCATQLDTDAPLVQFEFETRMKNASKMIRDWSKNNGKRPLPNHWHLTRAKLSLKSNKYCHLVGKGWHTTVVLQFLLDFTQQVPCDPVLKSCIWLANNWLGLLHDSRDGNTLLSADEIEQAVAVGKFYQVCYLKLHFKYRNFCPYLLFNLRPKFHVLSHFFDLCKRIRNPLCSSTLMDESVIGSVMRLASKCHKRTVQKSALQRYCAGLPYVVLNELGQYAYMPNLYIYTSLQDILAAGLKAELEAAVEALRKGLNCMPTLSM